MKSRIYGETTDIDSNKINKFFDSRISINDTLASAMLRSDAEADIAHKRNENEKALLNKLVDFSTSKTVLDIGCGLGRWADNFAERIVVYDGIDFAGNYIEKARNIFSEKNNINFYQMSVENMDRSILDKNYDLIIINGLCMYLNDISLKAFLRNLNNFASVKTTIYIRESISVMDERLTLKDFPSIELGMEYSAIYRTESEYNRAIVNNLVDFRITQSELLLDSNTGARAETNQCYWLLKNY